LDSKLIKQTLLTRFAITSTKMKEIKWHKLSS